MILNKNSWYWAPGSLSTRVHAFTVCLALVAALMTFDVSGQSKTTQKLQEEYKDSRAFFFYNNTLRMINQSEDPEFDEAIKDIEKMKLLLVGKNAANFDFNKIVKDYKEEAFEEVLTSRHKGKNFDIFLKERDGKTSAMLALVNDDDNLFVLDIVGSIDPNKMMKFFSVMNEKSDISGRIKNFVTRNDDSSDDEKAPDEGNNKPEE